MSRLVSERISSETELAKRPHVGSALFHYYCVAHRSRSLDRSPVTIYEGHWAFCMQGYGKGHDWVAIDPISDVDLLRFGPRFLARPEPELVPA